MTAGPRRLPCLLLATFLLLLSTMRPARAAAGDADEAELHFQLGADRYERGDFTGALEHFLASNRLAPNRNVTFNIARAFENLGRFPEAYRYYVSVAALPGTEDAQTTKAIEEALIRISKNVAVLDVVTTPPGAALYVDRVDLGSVGTSPARLGQTAGTYKVIATLDGYEPATSPPLEISLGARVPVALTLRRIVGRVGVVGQPGYAVHVDDEDATPTCTSPCTVDLPPGPHVLFLTKPGYATVPRQVAVVAGKTTSVKASATALTGSVLVAADEPGALVEIDGRPRGFTPGVIAGIPVGRRVVRVSLRGYQPLTREIEVVVNQEYDLGGLRLVPIREIAAASRRAEKIEDAPASVSVITSQELAAFGYPTILEALRGVRGFATTYDSIYGNASVRGLGQPNDFTNRLLVLGDGAVLNENILYQPFTHFDGRVDLDDVERIEVVRGPGSVLYGTGAVSGVVNLVTRSRDEPAGVTVGASTFGDVARARANMTLSFGKDAGLWASVSGARSEGRTQPLRFDQDGDGRDEVVDTHGFDRFKAYTVAGRVWWKEVTAQWFYTDRHIHIPTASYSSIFDRAENKYDDERFLLELRFEPKLGKKTQLLTRTYLNRGYFHLDYLYEAEDEASGTPWEQPYHETYVGTWAGGEARVVYEATPALRLSVGSEAARHFEVAIDTEQREFDGSASNLNDIDVPYTVLAGYGVVEWIPTAKLRFSAGMRADSWRFDDEDSQDFLSFNPRLAIIAKPGAADTVKLMGGRAFRAPSPYELFYNDSGTTQALSNCCGETLEPETVVSVELEATHTFSELWTAIGSAYFMNASHVVETALVPDDVLDLLGYDEGTTYYRNSDVDQRIFGVDAEVRHEWHGGVMAQGQVGVIHASADGERIPNTPQLYGSVKAVAPLVTGLMNGAVRVTVEAPRRIDGVNGDTSPTAVIADVVLSGAISSQGLRYNLGLYNALDWTAELPASPFASRLMPQHGRTFMLGVALTR